MEACLRCDDSAIRYGGTLSILYSLETMMGKDGKVLESCIKSDHVKMFKYEW